MVILCLILNHTLPYLDNHLQRRIEYLAACTHFKNLSARPRHRNGLIVTV